MIKNTGDVPVTNLEVVDHYDEAFEPRFTDPGREILPNGDFRWKIARLEKGERREIQRPVCVRHPGAQRVQPGHRHRRWRRHAMPTKNVSRS